MSEKLVLMEKNGELSEVHPTCVKAHEAVGWTVSEQAIPAKAGKPKADAVAAAEEKTAPTPPRRNGKSVIAAEIAAAEIDAAE